MNPNSNELRDRLLTVYLAAHEHSPEKDIPLAHGNPTSKVFCESLSRLLKDKYGNNVDSLDDDKTRPGLSPKTIKKIFSNQNVGEDALLLITGIVDQLEIEYGQKEEFEEDKRPGWIERSIQFWQRLNSRVMILIGLVCVSVGVLIIVMSELGSDIAYAEVEMIGDVEFTTRLRPVKDITDISYSPISGGKVQKNFYGLNFYTLDYEVDFTGMDSNSEIAIYSPNEIFAQGTGGGINEMYHPNFGIGFFFLKMSKNDMLYHKIYGGLSSYVDSMFSIAWQNNSNDFRTWEVNTGINIRNVSHLDVYCIDSFSNSSLIPMPNSKVSITKNRSKTHDRSSSYQIESKGLDNLSDGTYPHIDILGEVVDYMFDFPATITNNEGDTLFTAKESDDSIGLLVGSAQFNQRIMFSKPKPDHSIKIYTSSPFTDYHYSKAFYTLNTKAFTSTPLLTSTAPVLEMVPLLLNHRPNGIHYFGGLSDISSSQTIGAITQHGKTIELDYPQKVRFENIDSFEAFHSPIAFCDRKGLTPNEFSLYGNVIVGEEDVTPKTNLLLRFIMILIICIGIFLVLHGVDRKYFNKRP